jgi:glucokinase
VLRLGIDLGGSKTVLAIGDIQGRVRARRRYATEPSGDPQRDVARLLAECRGLLAEAGLAPGELSGVGVAAPGPIDPEAGLVLGAPNLPGWERVALREALAQGLGQPVWLENDADAAALAEWRFGAARGARDAVYLTMSTGVGAGLILDGRLHRGARGNAGEFGHVPIVPDGEPCACGQRGCLEAYVGGAAWARRLREHAPESSACLALAGSRDALGPEHVLRAAAAGDAFARAELDRFNAHLIRGLVAVVFSLAPQVIVLGTIVAAAGEACLEPLREGLRQRVWPVLAREVAILPAALGERLPELAGLCAAFERGEAAD